MATMTQATGAAAKGGKAPVYKNFINGEWVESHIERTFENLNPAIRRIRVTWSACFSSRMPRT